MSSLWVTARIDRGEGRDWNCVHPTITMSFCLIRAGVSLKPWCPPPGIVLLPGVVTNHPQLSAFKLHVSGAFTQRENVLSYSSGGQKSDAGSTGLN